MKRLTALAFASVLPFLAQGTARPRPRMSQRAAVLSPAARKAALAEITERMGPGTGHIENPEALQPLFEKLATIRAGGSPVHILQFGDSHTASDDWVDSMRQFEQSRYGNGGPGFAMAGRPYHGYRRFDIRGDNSSRWEAEGTVSHPGDERGGLGGISLTADSPGQTIWTSTAGEELDLLYLQQPGGGKFSLEVDGQPYRTVDTNGELSTGIFTYKALPGEHIYAIDTLTSAPVRVFGWVSQNTSGVTWETLGINGAQASMILGWDESIWTQQIQQRNPALVVLAYGTNEANSRLFDRETFRGNLTDLIARFRRSVPGASLLLVGPPDCGQEKPLIHLDEVVETERAVAKEQHIAFWDWRERMGGPRSTMTWVRSGLGQPDHVHLTGAGYRLVGQTLTGDLDIEFQRFLASATSAAPAPTTQLH